MADITDCRAFLRTASRHRTSKLLPQTVFGTGQFGGGDRHRRPRRPRELIGGHFRNIPAHRPLDAFRDRLTYCRQVPCRNLRAVRRLAGYKRLGNPN